MQQTMIPNSGIMTVPQIAAPQLVYLDFDGELASYNGELLTIDRVEVEDSGLTQPQIIRIVSELNKEFEGQNIVFTAEKPASGEYSTVFIRVRAVRLLRRTRGDGGYRKRRPERQCLCDSQGR